MVSDAPLEARSKKQLVARLLIRTKEGSESLKEHRKGLTQTQTFQVFFYLFFLSCCCVINVLLRCFRNAFFGVKTACVLIRMQLKCLSVPGRIALALLPSVKLETKNESSEPP